MTTGLDLCLCVRWANIRNHSYVFSRDVRMSVTYNLCLFLTAVTEIVNTESVSVWGWRWTVIRLQTVTANWSNRLPPHREEGDGASLINQGEIKAKTKSSTGNNDGSTPASALSPAALFRVMQQQMRQRRREKMPGMIILSYIASDLFCSL